jgi:hypothetical protein
MFKKPVAGLDAFQNLVFLTPSAVLLSYSKTANYAVVWVYNKSPIAPERQVSREP